MIVSWMNTSNAKESKTTNEIFPIQNRQKKLNYISKLSSATTWNIQISVKRFRELYLSNRNASRLFMFCESTSNQFSLCFLFFSLFSESWSFRGETRCHIDAHRRLSVLWLHWAITCHQSINIVIHSAQAHSTQMTIRCHQENRQFSTLEPMV